ncbi:hypothetical protein PIB30_083702 [Stylosanthes scabra]|uniref:RNase H type-1 domain-containing protein n=1 Tax=Stylosanthes scabra TaxID=79078 RepID=A0ABU6RS79_9FABA|nr:hypothetical protein [Stylosanthes scabra]
MGVSRRAGCGGVLRNEQGRWLAGYSFNMDTVTAYNAELQGVVEGLSLAWRLGIRRLGLDARKRVSHIFYRVPAAVVSSGIKYDCFSVESDEDLQVLFHCRQQFPEVRTTELYVEIADVGASSGGSNPHPQPVYVGPTHCPPDVGGPSMAHVASPSFDVNLPQGNDDGYDFDDNHSFDELAVAIAAAPQPPSPHMGHVEPEPLVEEALRCDGSDEEPMMIEGDNDDDEGTIPVSREVPTSSRTQQYPPHFSTLNLEAGSAAGPADGGSEAFVHGSIGSSVGGDKIT